MRRLFAILFLALVGLSCGKTGQKTKTDEVVVFAAASLREVMTEIGRAHEAQNPGSHVIFNFAGSNELAQQILAAPKADLFLSASEDWMDKLEKAGRLEPGSRKALLSNRLVIVTSRDSALSIKAASDLETA